MQVQGKVFKSGTSYGVRLSKLWVDSGIVKEGDLIPLELPIKLKSGLLKGSTRDFYLRRMVVTS